MINRILNTGFIKGKKAGGLVYKILPNGNISFSIVIAKLEKGNISIESGQTNIDDPKDVLKFIGSQIPLVILVDGKGVIHRKVEKSDGPEWLRTVLPNANKEDFFVQHCEASENSVFVSIARKDLLKCITDELINLGLKPVDLLLGPFCVEQIIPFLDIKNNELKIDEYKLIVEENKIIDYSANDNSEVQSEIRMGDENIEADKLLPFAAAFRYFFHLPILGNDENMLAKIKDDFLWGRFFKMAGLSALIFSFSLLLVNFLLFDHFNKNYQDVSAIFESNKVIIREADSLKISLQKRKAFMTKAGLLGQTKFSFFADRLASKMPSGINLNMLSFNPIVKKINESEKIGFAEQRIIIKGNSTDSYKINSWIKEIRTENWVKDVTLENYSQPPDRSYGQFELNVLIR